MKLKCLESTDSNGIEQYLIPLGDGSFIAVPKKRIEHRQNGEWIEDPINKNIMYCSNCKVGYTKDFLRGMSLYHEPKDTPDFCPNCGARMKGAVDETNY